MIGSYTQRGVAAMADVLPVRNVAVSEDVGDSVSVDHALRLTIAWQDKLAVATSGTASPQPAAITDLDFRPESDDNSWVSQGVVGRLPTRLRLTNSTQRSLPLRQESESDNDSSGKHIIHYKTLSILLRKSCNGLVRLTEKSPDSDSRRDTDQRFEWHPGGVQDPFQFPFGRLQPALQSSVMRLGDAEFLGRFALTEPATLSPRLQSWIRPSLHGSP